MFKLLFCIVILAGIAVQENAAAGSCRNANWWSSFDRTGWSKCPSALPYIRGLYRNIASRPSHDWIYLLEEASCCDDGKPNAECVQANWAQSFNRQRTWNLCPTGYCLSGLYRSQGHYLQNIEHAWCCKPRGAPNSYKSCYTENVVSKFDWNRKGMVSCTKAGHYITGLYRSTCNYMNCIEYFKCCQMQETASSATCSATGDPHYRTFDGRLIHFQGECQYVLAKDVNNQFSVLAKNKKCGSTVACTNEVTVKVKNLVIVIKRGGTVTVLGVVKTLPYSNQGVNIKRVGIKVQVTTDVGLTVNYNCVYNVYITVAAKYRGKTRGICGNYNGNPNDLLKSDNKVTGNDQEFANSWKVDESCPDPGPPINPCTTAGAQAQIAKRKCALLKQAPFSACHNHVNVNSGFIQDCEFDVCACKDNPLACVCEAYSAYVTSCGYAGINIKWKHLAQFRHCSSACASAPCLNGGVCNNHGSSFKCTCPQGYLGDRCQTEVQATCSATGDPHYRTFDGKTYNFMGQCEYVLAKDTEHKFVVLAKNKPCGSLSRKVTCTFSVTVKVKGLEIKLLRGGLVQISGKHTNLPYNNRGVKIVKHGLKAVRVTTDIGLKVQFNGVYNVFVTVYGRYKGKTLGLCGTFNGNKNDDFKKPNNQITTSAQDFGISWKVHQSCRDGGPVGNPCQNAGATAQEAKKKCAVMRGLPFSPCNNLIKVDSGFIQNCEYDVCACKGHSLACLCEQYAAYVDTCALAGVNIKWRHLTQFRECQTPCAYAPCLNGGICTNAGQSYRCTCPAGFKGSRCETEETAQCSATGDPHYHTFDGRRYNFMGACEYVLSKDVNNNFLVLTKNQRCRGQRFSCVLSVSVTIKGLKIKITRGGHFTVFGIRKNAPYRNQGVIITKEGLRTIKIQSDIGVSVRYDGVYNVFVTVSARYRGKTAGLCGNYNGNANDEFIDVNFRRSTSILHFADSWKVDRSCPNTKPSPNPCLTASSVAQQAKKKCQLLKQQPFAKCHNEVHQDAGFIKDCEFDVCACNNHPSSCLCEEFAAYATSCSLVGVPISWRNLPQFAECNAPCASGPCRNGAICTNKGKDYSCACAAGYSGNQCETRTCTNPKALGMESGKIPDSRITASSEWSHLHGATNARLNFAKNSGSWSSRYNNQNQWLQVDFKFRATITDILTQGRGRYNHGGYEAIRFHTLMMVIDSNPTKEAVMIRYSQQTLTLKALLKTHSTLLSSLVSSESILKHGRIIFPCELNSTDALKANHVQQNHAFMTEVVITLAEKLCARVLPGITGIDVNKKYARMQYVLVWKMAKY
ncbi:IgGFc-binding protein-like [Dendronephthya gigantea]|uniref:IgGFc-binding protein-like n=1 Tax=Dendronephthya gigantea TaxID=151771 RepID=UPI00106CA57F|nr:IgGFc-binding protein-like [Dendronephthya gigantea]